MCMPATRLPCCSEVGGESSSRPSRQVGARRTGEDAALAGDVLGGVDVVARDHAHGDARALAGGHRVWHLLAHRVLQAAPGGSRPSAQLLPCVASTRMHRVGCSRQTWHHRLAGPSPLPWHRAAPTLIPTMHSAVRFSSCGVAKKSAGREGSLSGKSAVGAEEGGMADHLQPRFQAGHGVGPGASATPQPQHPSSPLAPTCVCQAQRAQACGGHAGHGAHQLLTHSLHMRRPAGRRGSKCRRKAHAPHAASASASTPPPCHHHYHAIAPPRSWAGTPRRR